MAERGEDTGGGRGRIASVGGKGKARLKEICNDKVILKNVRTEGRGPERRASVKSEMNTFDTTNLRPRLPPF